MYTYNNYHPTQESLGDQTHRSTALSSISIVTHLKTQHSKHAHRIPSDSPLALAYKKLPRRNDAKKKGSGRRRSLKELIEENAGCYRENNQPEREKVYYTRRENNYDNGKV